MHAGSVCVYLRLWHKGSVKPMPFCNGTHCYFKGHNVISHFTDLITFEINLMLCRCSLMMGRLDLHTHVFQIQHHVPSCILTKIHRTDIQITCLLMSQCGRHSVIICVEQEKFAFRVDVAGLIYIWNCAHLAFRPVCKYRTTVWQPFPAGDAMAGS